MVAELGDLTRFETPKELMAYLGLVPSEHSSGTTVRRGGITKTGNGHVRRVLIEAAWAYAYGARNPACARAIGGLAARGQEIAWKAQFACALATESYGPGQIPNSVVTATARELSAFMWAIVHGGTGNRLKE